jgi:predicted AlkP superfamily pyrophosphatase or phosphodiesterase
MRGFFSLFVILLCQPALLAQSTRPDIPQAQHVVIISIDGLRPDVLLRAAAPHIRQMCDDGSFTFWARTTAASTTIPSHVSMLTGVTPEAHTILWNRDLPFSAPVYPAVPTLFELAHKAGYTTAMAVGKTKLNVLDKPGTIDWKFIPATGQADGADIASHAVQILHDHQPTVMFIHFPAVDNAGHKFGWGTAEQLEAIETTDKCVGTILDALETQKLRDATLVILTADHGGAGRTHGPEDPRSRTIPWIITGPGVRKGFDLSRLGRELDVETFDTFATSCAALRIPVTRPINGKCILQAFQNQELLAPTDRKM